MVQQWVMVKNMGEARLVVIQVLKCLYAQYIILFWLSKQDSLSAPPTKKVIPVVAVDTPVYEAVGRMWLNYLYIFVQNNVFL